MSSGKRLVRNLIYYIFMDSYIYGIAFRGILSAKNLPPVTSRDERVKCVFYVIESRPFFEKQMTR